VINVVNTCMITTSVTANAVPTRTRLRNVNRCSGGHDLVGWSDDTCQSRMISQRQRQPRTFIHDRFTSDSDPLVGDWIALPRNVSRSTPVCANVGLVP